MAPIELSPFAHWRSLLTVFLLFFAATSCADRECERLKASLTYTQEEAPRDLSGVLPVVVERINQVLEGVVDVEVEWTGADLQGRVGEHIVQCKVTRLASSLPATAAATPTATDDEGRAVVTQCFHVPFSILDTNECKLQTGHPMQHQCHESTICINTIGAYECLCPRNQDKNPPAGTTATDEAFWERIAQQERSSWEVSFSLASRTSCPGQPSTYGCCPAWVRKDGATCRSAFRCPVDPCRGNHTCAPSATCTLAAKPLSEPNYTCKCPAGLLGNGHKCRPGIDPKPQPKVMFDGVTPTEETIRNNYYCDCTKPIVDACSGFPPCKGKHEICVVTAGNVPKCRCKPGYVMHEKYGCVDESPPTLRLNNDPQGDQTLRLKQGDVYKEYAVEIQDENAEEYLRSLKIAYSQPLPNGCFTHIGQFHVNYTVATPWTSPPYVRVTRQVIIEDIDECSLDVAVYATKCPRLIPQCDTEAGATCVNTVGSYTCQCPEYTAGDGFKSGLTFDPIDAPEGFAGGTSCRDTHPPIIELEGPNPKVFRVCACGGITGVMGQTPSDSAELRRSQQGHYHHNVKELVRTTAGAELCATPAYPKPNAIDCARAYDLTYKGRVDLSRQVRIGEPIQKSALHWTVPYDVSDAAGNAAVTVWRDVVVEEVDLVSVESTIRREAMEDKKIEIKAAVQKALEESQKKKRAEIEAEVQKAVEEDRKKRIVSDSRGARKCPPCPTCDCEGAFEESMCQAICESARSGSCTIHEDSVLVRIMLWMEDFLPVQMIPIILFTALFVLGLTTLRWFLTLIFSPSSRSKTYIASDERERAMQRSVTVIRSPPVNGIGSGLPPAASMGVGGSAGSHQSFFSPQQGPPMTSPSFVASPATGLAPSGQRSGMVEQNAGYQDIYASPDVITPRRRGEGVYRGSPFGPR